MTLPSNPAVTGTGSPLSMAQSPAEPHRGSTAVALLRITLGVILLVTWWNNLSGDLYTADGLTGFFDWLYKPAEEGGNGSTLGFYQSFLDSVIRPAAGPYALFQLVFELALGVALLIGLFTRAASLATAIFFVTIFLGYFGGEEWIWTYVLLIASAVTVFLGYGGRALGLDRALAARLGDSPLAAFV